MAPLIASIVGMLVQQKLPKVAEAVMDKGIEYVENKLGVKLEPDMSQEKIVELKLAAQQHEEFQIQEANKNTDSARNMNVSIQSTDAASWLSKNTAYLLDFIIILATIVASALAFFVGVPPENKEIVYMAIGSLITMTGTVLNFHRGSSHGSATKQSTIDKMVSSKG